MTRCSSRPTPPAASPWLGVVLALLALAAPVAAQIARPAADREPVRLIEIASADVDLVPATVPLDVAALDRARGRAQVLARDAVLAELDALGVGYDVVVPDLQAFYASRLEPLAEPVAGLGTLLSPPFGQGAIGGYYDFGELVSILDQLTAAYPAITTSRFSIGTSLEGRDIWAIKISDNPDVDENEPEVRLDAMHHAREPMSAHTALWFVLWLLDGYGNDPLATHLVEEREIWFLPCVNPDGYVYNQSIAPGGGGLWRKNRRDNGDGTFGVDNNRNYPFQWGLDDSGSSPFGFDEDYRGSAPASEPETQAMVAFLASRDFSTALSLHSFSNVWLAPWGYTFTPPAQAAELDEIGALATEVNGYPAGQGSTLLYPVNGGTIDQDLGVHGTLSWTPEIGSSSDGFWPPTSRIVPLAEENLLAIQRTVLAAGAWARLESTTVTDLGDGDGVLEAGETVGLDVGVRNSGLLATASTAASISSPTPGVSIVTGAAALGPLAPFTSTATGTPLTLALDASMPAGTVVKVDVAVTYDGLTSIESLSLLTGTPRLLVTDDVETDLGWTTGLPGDTADTGLWERAVPVGNETGGEPLAPDEDATPGAGTFAFVTGNGSPDAGVDDIDDGFTTLLTPVFDLAGLDAAVVAYERWWADLGSTSNDDEFVVEVSNDAGGSWAELETVTSTENAWTEVLLPLHEAVALTDAMQIRFVAGDDPNNSLAEAGVDEFRLEVYDALPRFVAFGTSELGTPIRFATSGAAGGDYSLFFSPFTGNLPIPGIDGALLLDLGTLFKLLDGTIPGTESDEITLTLPADPGLSGVTVHLQALVDDDGTRAFSNRSSITLQ